MHDDLIDMVDWAVGEGIAQKDKIAIFGVSYGGLASFIAAKFTPEVFCCAVPLVGISHLQTLLESMPPHLAGVSGNMYRSSRAPRTQGAPQAPARSSPTHRR